MTIPTLPPEVARLLDGVDAMCDRILNEHAVFEGVDFSMLQLANRRAREALAHLSIAAEAAAWQVWWGIGEMRPHWPPFKTENEARDHASMIKSNTEVRPLYTHPAPPASASAPRAQEEAEGLTTLTVRTRHPADYVLANEQDGTRWRGTDEGRWTAVHEGGEDGEPVARVDCRGVLVPTQHGVKTLSPGQPVYSRTQPAAASAAVREALELAEAALADIGDADREPGDDLAWCEARASEALPAVRLALAAAPDVPPAEVDIRADVNWLKGQIEVMPDAVVVAAFRGTEVAQAAPVDALAEPMRLEVALDFADNPRRKSTMQAPADTMDELYRALAVLAREYRAAQALVRATPSDKPIDMVLHCPACGMQHVDAVEDLPMAVPGSMAEGSAGWTNPPHRSHLCHGCGYIWRPADVPTNGVEKVKTKGKSDSPIAKGATPRVEVKPLTPEYREQLRQEVLKAIEERIPAVRANSASWRNWPGTWVFADCAVSVLAAHGIGTHPEADKEQGNG